MTIESLCRPVVTGIAIAACAGQLLGCAARGGAPAREWLDAAAGVTVASAAEPSVFAHSEARYSRSERDYLYLGPVETNRRGTREYYLWIGVATTLDRGYLAPPAATPDRLYVEVGEEWMELSLGPWSEREPALEMPVYRTRVKLSDELAARVTSDQLALLEREPPRAVKLAAGETALQEYARWDDRNAWPALVSAGTRRSARETRER